MPPPPAHSCSPQLPDPSWWTRRGYDDEARLLEMAFCTFCTFCNVERGGDLCFELRRAMIGRDVQQPGEWAQVQVQGFQDQEIFGKAAAQRWASVPQAHTGMHKEFPIGDPPPARTDVNSDSYCGPRLMMVEHREGDSAGGGVDTENTLRFCVSGVFPCTKYWHQHQNQHQHQHQLLQESVSASGPPPSSQANASSKLH